VFPLGKFMGVICN